MKIEITGMRYLIIITDNEIKVHNRTETIDKWTSMLPEEIESPNAREWWVRYKDSILGLTK